jgi:hypothetical protein
MNAKNLGKFFASLDAVREGGSVNMFGAGPVLQEIHPNLTSKEAGNVLIMWMETFDDETCAFERAEKALAD